MAASGVAYTSGVDRVAVVNGIPFTDEHVVAEYEILATIASRVAAADAVAAEWFERFRKRGDLLIVVVHGYSLSVCLASQTSHD